MTASANLGDGGGGGSSRGLGACGGHILFVRRFAQRCVCGGCFRQRRAAACSAASLAADDASLRCQLWHRRVPPASVGGGSKLSKCVESGAATCSSKKSRRCAAERSQRLRRSALVSTARFRASDTLRPRPRSVRALHLCEPPVHLGRARAALPRRSGLDAPLPQRSRPRRGGDSARRGDLSYSQRWRRRATPRAR